MQYKIKSTGQVIVADLDFVQAVFPSDFEAVVVADAADPALPRHITELAFINRFTDAEAIAIDLSSIGTTVEAATVRRYLSKVRAAKYIDLDDPQIRPGVTALESAGILTAGRAAEILDSPILESERP
jgi:hypothetical protein